MRTTDGKYHPLMWLKSNKPDELIWSPYGVHSKQSTLAFETRDELVRADDATPRQYYMDQLIPRGIPIDHFMSHRDGSFHLKARNEKPLYSHTLRMLAGLGPRSPVFLQVSILSDVAVDYRIDEPQGPEAVVIMAELGAGIGINLAAAGDQYPIEGFIADNQPSYRRRGPVFSLGQFRIASYLWPHWPDIKLPNRPRGTFITLRFMTQSGHYRHKTFVFN